ncbi:unnamed protein product [Phytophthora fragariaefolia]|uniref:Unnamed protein product n=1 Tax=Phytophthora fragariaefolia TaxID=1490495 RepID=A0A9W6YBZ6_9STRA|nr:unnamed protein product [Phytophthora fragariaefolia]
MLRTLSPTEQHGVALGFIMKEQREVAARATVSTPSTPRVESLKLHVNSYVGREGEPLLRWLVEVDTAITARRIVDPLSKVAFAMSCLGGRARSWAYGRRLTDPTCFSTYEVFKQELRQAFEPPQNEFRSRAEFLDLQQGKHDVHAYAQRARYLVSNIVTNPIAEATKVVTFMKGLRDGPVKTYLFQEYPTRLDFEEVELPRSLLEVRLATGVVVRTEKRVVRARFSHEEKTFVNELIVLELDDKFDTVLGMPWLARHDPVIDWAKRTIVRFRDTGATESDDPVSAAHAPRGACDPPAEAARGAAASDLSARTLTTERVVGEKYEPNQKTQIRSDLRGSRSVKGDAVVSTVVDTQVEQEWPVTEGSNLGASTPGADAIGPNIKGRSAVRRRGKRGASAPGADAASSADSCKRPAPEMLACSRAAGLYDEAVHNQAGLDCARPRDSPADEQKHVCSRAAGLHDEAELNQAGLDCVRPHVNPAGEKKIVCSRAAGLHDEAIHNQVGLYCVHPRAGPAGDQKKDLSTTGPGQNKTRGTGFRTRSERRKRAKLRKSRSGTETSQAVSAGQTQRLETTVETLSVLTRTDTGL